MLVYESARREAQRLLDDHWDGNLPVSLDVMTLAVSASKYETSMGAGLSGLVSKERDKQPIIALNSDESAPRRRFTWAHEIGHIVERDRVAHDRDYSFTEARGQKYDLHEFFADEFAGALLMPQSDILSMSARGLSNQHMAETFGVSRAAVAKRLESLAKTGIVPTSVSLAD
ncbi:ImmA/IrrE family metallo-endopeptidase [Helcobacillus massiliensis]